MRNAVTASLLALFALLAALALAACGGSPNTPNGSYVGSPGGPQPPPTQLVKTAVTVTVAGAGATLGSLHRNYVSPGTQSVVVGLASVDGGSVTGVNATTIETVPGAPSCKSQGTALTCSGAVWAAVGSDTFNVTTFDGPNATGNVLSAGTVSHHVANGSSGFRITNGLSLDVGGVIASLSLAVKPSTIARGKPAVVPVALAAFDASGAQIVGASDYQTPIQLAISGDAVGAFSLRGAGGGTSTSILRPTTHVDVAYNGNAQATSITLQASVSGPHTASASATLAVAGTPPPPPPGTLYVLDAGTAFGQGATVTEYAGDANGNAAPLRTLQLSSTLYARSIAVDASGKLYVGYYDTTTGAQVATGTPDTGNEIAVYAAGASGTAAPESVITAHSGSQTTIFPVAMAFDAAGDLVTYGNTTVDANAGNAVLIYASGSSGSVAPAHAWSYAAPLINYAGPTGLALDGSGNFYTNGVFKTSLGPAYALLTNVAAQQSNPSVGPARTLPWDTTTKLTPGLVTDVSLTSSGEVVIGNDALVTLSGSTGCQAQGNVYTGGATGGTTDVAPLRIVQFGGAVTTNPLCFSSRNPLVAFFPYVAAYGTSLFVADEYNNALAAYSALTGGSVSPTTRIAGSATGLNVPIGVVVAPPSSSALHRKGSARP